MRRLFALLILTALVALPVAADTELSGQTPGGAFYSIVVPDAWNGGLVIYNHGFSLSPPGPDVDRGLLEQVQLIQGFAVAASSYQQAGWAVFKSTEDLRELVDAFRAEFGEPDEIYIYGGSLGGLVTIAAVEQGGLGNVVGAASLCGVIGGSRNWEGALDLRLLYDQVCSKIPEARLPGGAEGLPKGSTLSSNEVGAALNACTGIFLDPEARSNRQKKNLRTLLRVSGLPESFLPTVMGYVTFAMRDLVHSPDKLKGRLGVGNVGVDYGNKRINRKIERVEANRRGERKLFRNYTPTGNVGDVKVVAIHTDKDGLVIVENLGEYAELAPADRLTTAVVVEDQPSHCSFTVSEGLAAWQGLLDWVSDDNQSTAADLQALCGEFEPLFGGPCRFDPSFVIPDMDGRVRPR